MRKLTAPLVVVALSLGAVGTPLLTDPAAAAASAPADNFTGQHVQNTLNALIKDAQRLAEADGRDTVTEADIVAALAGAGKRAWEQGTDFTLTTQHSAGLGSLSFYTAPDGTIGLAMADADAGSCAMASLAPDAKKVTLWSFDAALGKNCSGKVAAGGQTDTPPPYLDPIPPAQLADPAVTVGDSSLLVSWPAAPESDVVAYRVYVDGVKVAETSDTEVTVTGLVNYTDYQVTVTAVDEAENEAAPSAPVTGTPVDLTPPDVPAALAAEPGDSRVALTWAAVTADDLAHYVVYVDGTAVGTVPAGTTRFEVSGLTNYVSYALTVTAVDIHDNESAASAAVSANPVDLTPPPVPAEPTASAGDTQVTVDWDAVTADDLEHYVVYVNGTAIATVPAPTTAYTVTGLTNGVGYTFTVTAVDTHGNESAASVPVTATPADLTAPDVPTNFTAVGSGTQVALTWTRSAAPDTQHYTVYVDGADVATVPAGTTSYTVTGLAAGSTHTFAVAAVDRAGNTSTRTSAVSVTLVAAFDSLQSGPNMIAPRSDFSTAVAPDGKIYVTGGRNNGSGAYTVHAEVFNPATNKWTLLPTMPRARAHHASVFGPDGKLYLVGGKRYLNWQNMPGATNGYYQGGTYDTVIDVYNPATNTWSTLPGVSITGQSHAASAIDAQGRVYLVGGYDTVGTYTYDNPSKLVQRFDPATGTVTKLANLPYGRVKADAAIAGDGKVYLVGGYTGYYITNATHRYDPATNTWTQAANSLNSSQDAGMSVDSEGRIVRFGGESDPVNYHNTVQRYDYRTNQWTKVASMPEGIYSSAAFTDAAGRVYSIGGEGWGWGYTPKKLVVRLNLDGTLTQLPNLQYGRGNAEVAVGPDGTAFIIGGLTNFDTPTTAVERFTPSPVS